MVHGPVKQNDMFQKAASRLGEGGVHKGAGTIKYMATDPKISK
jgi:hypothetical protein